MPDRQLTTPKVPKPEEEWEGKEQDSIAWAYSPLKCGSNGITKIAKMEEESWQQSTRREWERFSQGKKAHLLASVYRG
jgi:hypothetical protein